MRLAPVAIRHWPDRDAWRDVAARQSQTTHDAPEAVDACIAFAEILADAIRGAPRSNVLLPYNYPSAGKIASIMVSSWRGKHRDEIASSGYVAHSLEAALWCDGRTDHRAVGRRDLWGKRHSDLEGAAGLGDKISARASELFAASLERAD